MPSGCIGCTASSPRPGRCDLAHDGGAPFNVVAMAGSAGALPVILAQLNRLTFANRGALFVAYHRVHFPAFQLDRFAPLCTSTIRSAVAGEPVQAGHVYFPKDAQDLTVSAGRLQAGRSAARNHPNLDNMLTSLAGEYGPRLSAVLLSGMARDGLAGLEAVRAAGGRIVVQSPGSCSFPQLPQAAIDAGLGDDVLGLPELHVVVEDALAT